MTYTREAFFRPLVAGTGFALVIIQWIPKYKLSSMFGLNLLKIAY